MAANEKPRSRRGSSNRQTGQDWRLQYTARTRTTRLVGPRQRGFIRELLPDATAYYSTKVEKLGRPNGAGWAECRCPFHDDRHASACANLVNGAFRCHGCGAHGDLLAFHMLLTGFDFNGAARDLGAWR